MSLDTLEVLTLFVDNLDEAKAFYQKVFAPEVIYEDEASSLVKFANLMINLLDVRQAGELVEPASVAPRGAGARFLLTVRVEDVDATCRVLRSLGIALLNGPMDRPWGRRTAAFADPSGHVWEVAQVI